MGKKILGRDLYFFPRGVEGIKKKEEEYRKLISIDWLPCDAEELYRKHSSFGIYILNFGIKLIDTGFLRRAGDILSQVCGCTNWDNTWPYALFHQARIAAILEEEEFMYEYLRWSFTAETYFRDIVSKKDDLRGLVCKYPEFDKYQNQSRFKAILKKKFSQQELKEFEIEIEGF